MQFKWKHDDGSLGAVDDLLRSLSLQAGVPRRDAIREDVLNTTAVAADKQVLSKVYFL